MAIQSTRKNNENGSSSTNFMLDDVIETLKKHGIENDELVKELTIQKIRYGKTCIIHQISFEESDILDQLDKKIKEVSEL